MAVAQRPVAAQRTHTLGTQTGHPVLRWMAGNVALTADPAANVKVDKQRSHEKVDGIVALVMAIGRAMTTADQDPVWPTFGAV